MVLFLQGITLFKSPEFIWCNWRCNDYTNKLQKNKMEKCNPRSSNGIPIPTISQSIMRSQSWAGLEGTGLRGGTSIFSEKTCCVDSACADCPG